MLSLFLRLSLLLTGLVMLIGLLPTSAGLPPEVADAFAYFISVARGFDWLFPMNTLFTILKLFVVFEIALLLFKILRWFLHLFSSTAAAGTS